MRILILDNNIDRDSWGAHELRHYAGLASGATITTRRGPQDDLPEHWSRYDRLVISGSKTSCLDPAPWTLRLEALIRGWLDTGKPLLGVCYGQQLLCRSLEDVSIVRKSETPEFGWTEIQTIRSNRLFHGLPTRFHTFSSHNEEVARLPKGMHTLAQSDRCAIQAVQLGERPVFGIQFHPERFLEAGERQLQSRRKEKKLNGILRSGDGKKLYSPKVGETLFHNFFSL